MVVSLRNVLFATDFSSCSEAALPYGVGMCRRYEATLYTVSVVPSEITYDVQPPDPFYLRHTAERKMAKIVASGVFEGIKHHEYIKERFDSVSKVILDLIDSLHIDLIVLGMHGRDGIKKLVLGSVAEEIVNSAPCPVLTVGPQVAPKMISELKLKKILCATDLRPGSARVLSYAQALAKDKLPPDIGSCSQHSRRCSAGTSRGAEEHCNGSAFATTSSRNRPFCGSGAPRGDRRATGTHPQGCGRPACRLDCDGTAPHIPPAHIRPSAVGHASSRA